MPKILYCATVDYHFSAFHLPYMKWFKEQGWEVHVAAAGKTTLPFTDRKFNITIQRSPFKTDNLRAYRELKAIIQENDYQIIHCHTPLGGVLARLAAREARKRGTKVLYTAHGFHFCKGSSSVNWAVYYPIERFLSRYTDCLITINDEDYLLATNHKFNAGEIKQIHGVGVDTERFKPAGLKGKEELRNMYGYDPEAFLMFYAAEFNKNKNQQHLLKMLAMIKDELPEARLLLAGEGSSLEECKQLADRLGVSGMVDFLGLRKDIDRLLPMCDVSVASSFREGLPVNVMEAMASGLPVAAIDNRGHKELIQPNKNGFLTDKDNVELFANKILLLAKNKELRNNLGTNGRTLIKSKYSVHRVLEEKAQLYTKFMSSREASQWEAR
ncbi:glycosyltransferase family 4 protein [Evansella sp. LMS18]|uniref:glycosyltransferase family 4 protein n=1 Tax=Evansella sp. LMS18 TaxID=2924033 RepID=UPI0020D1443B|nr:glycosyltransferase family 4 protein [Evansella sp. LMS18]